MRAEIVSVGAELLLGQVVDSNAAALARLLAELGIEHAHRQTVGDDARRLADALQLALSRSDIVFTIGGLGPTGDDLTREGIAAALGETLVHDPDIEAGLRAIFAARGAPMVASNLRQAVRPPCAEPVPNPNGTAPGLICRKEGKVIIALPGPKAEFEPMLRGRVEEELRRARTGAALFSRTLRVCGIGESLVEDRIRHLLASSNPAVAPYAKQGEVHLLLTARAASLAEAESAIAPVEAAIRQILGDDVYGVDGTTLEATIIGMLAARAQTLAVAESCTGGGLGQRLTNAPGASRVFLGGLIAYADAVKEAQLGVSAATLASEGAVSEACARQMAAGARDRLRADWAVSVTGIAGPDGGAPEKPVGLVFIGVAGPGCLLVERLNLRGDRAAIRERAVAFALVHLRRALMRAL
jgi:nicotinamide-nucleotide amidase